MSFSWFETFCVNGSFVTLFLTMLAFWLPLLIPDRASFARGVGNIGLVVANGQLFIFLALRWLNSGHFPLSNLYESLMFLSWSFTVAHFILNSQTILLGALTAPSALFIHAFATFTLPAEFKAPTPLVPALQSNWLMMHVTLMILSYSLLLLGSLFAMAYLVVFVEPTQLESVAEGDLSSAPESDLSMVLDNLSYRTLGFGFPLLTIGILSGGIWANQAWGSYWSWDPKETWAFITWCVFAIYLHLRLNKQWRGKKPAIVATCGFFLLWICYLGVNLLGQGLHSYGWFNS